MSMKFRASSAALGGLVNLRWLGVSVAAANDKYYQITAPSFVVDKISTVLGAAPAGLNKITLRVNGNAVGPEWLQPGIAVQINITYSGQKHDFAGTISDVADDGKSFTVNPNARHGAQFSSALNAANLDAVGGGVVNTVTLNMQCQKAMFSVLNGEPGDVLLAPSAKADGSAVSYYVTLTAGGAEYEITAAVGSKFDLTDFWIKSSAGAPNLTIRFL